MELDEIKELEISLGISIGFFNDLLNEEDWSFVIKLHALIEAATTHLLIEHLDDERLSSVISFLELSNQRTGKIALLKALELMSSDYKRYIISLSELRNSLVHDVRNTQFSFRKTIKSYSEKEFSNFIKRYGLLLGDNEAINPMYLELARNDPKEFIWSGALTLLTFIYTRKRTSYYERIVKAVKLANME